MLFRSLAQARARLTERLGHWQRRPVFLLDGFDADVLTASFHA